MESRIQRSSLHLKHISRSQTQSLDNAISMLRSPLQRLKNEHVECSLQQLNPVLILVFFAHRCRHSTPTGGRLSTSFCIAQRAALTSIPCLRGIWPDTAFCKRAVFPVVSVEIPNYLGSSLSGVGHH